MFLVFLSIQVSTSSIRPKLSVSANSVFAKNAKLVLGKENSDITQGDHEVRSCFQLNTHVLGILNGTFFVKKGEKACPFRF